MIEPGRSSRPAPSGEELLAYILSFRPRHKECREYYVNQMPRLMMRFDYIKDLARSSKILEIGAPPFNATLVLRKLGFHNILCTNYEEDVGDTPQAVSSGEMKLYSPDLDEWQVFEVTTFDVEKDIWPYEDRSFDIVMGFEILEHLARDPLYMLSEANRVTKKGGILFLTTPNIVSIRKIVQMLKMKSPSECPYFRPAKALGARHNREWTPLEVRTALQAAGYEVIRLETMQISSPGGHQNWTSYIIDTLVKITRWRGDHIYALARKASGVKIRFPTEEMLYYHWDLEANLRLKSQDSK